MMDVYASSRRVDVGELELLVTDNGPTDGEAVVMLHGWPDTAHLWRHQIAVLVAAGYRVLAPDLRGFGGSDHPAEVKQYRVGASASDVTALLDEAGAERAHVISHDFGAAVGWAFALAHPDRVRSLTALSVGHPNSFNGAGLRQLQASWYMLLFQFEGIAEQFLSGDDWARFRRLVGGHPETERWIETLSAPGALTASLNWYRANSHPRRLVSSTKTLPACQVPTLGIWSSRDFALTEEQMKGSVDHVSAEWEYRRIEGASHWIPLDAAEDLNSLLVDWLSRHGD